MFSTVLREVREPGDPTQSVFCALTQPELDKSDNG